MGESHIFPRVMDPHSAFLNSADPDPGFLMTKTCKMFQLKKIKYFKRIFN
jgi:hypothetical protein